MEYALLALQHGALTRQRIATLSLPQSIASFVPGIMFFGSSLTFMLVYLWARRNPGLQIRQVHASASAFVVRDHTGGAQIDQCAPYPRPYSFSLLGLLAFNAPLLPWVLLGFSLLLGHDVTSDALGIAVGHLYFFVADVYPALAAARGWRWRRLLHTPWVL